MSRNGRLILRKRAQSKALYLVSAAGLPNYGDEFITRAWLDWLAKHRPEVDVWLDCPEPGRANHLFADAHPRLRTTNTLWHLAFRCTDMALSDAAETAARIVVEGGSPRFDLGLETLRQMSSIHLLGGGYLNSVWEHHLTLLPALVTLKQRFGVPIYATGQGVLPLDAEAAALVSRWVPDFELFEARDVEGAARVGGISGLDDAFLAFLNTRPIYSRESVPDVMLLMQGDFLESHSVEILADAAVRFIRSQGASGPIGLVESIPPDDSWILPRLKERGVDVDFFPFVRVWQQGLPARTGQRWLTTRFHFHLLAAAAGAQGAIIDLHPRYYGVKHGSLRELGTGWTYSDDTSSAPDPAVDPSFEHRRSTLARRKETVAHLIYS